MLCFLLKNSAPKTFYDILEATGGVRVFFTLVVLLGLLLSIPMIKVLIRMASKED